MAPIETEELSDEKLQMVSGQIFVGQAIMIAYQLGLFQHLSRAPLSLKNLSQSLGITERATQALISCACVLDLVECPAGAYQLTHLGQKFLNVKSDAWYGDVFELYVKQNNLMNFENIKKAILSNRPQVNQGVDIFVDGIGLGGTKDFIRALHQKSYTPAFYWASKHKLNNIKKLVDIGGGSGIHTIAACINNPELQGIVCEREEVLPFTQEFIREFELDQRITLNKLDMWKDPLPNGDAYFFGDIFHDWERQKCLFLARKSYQSLNSGGSIILHEVLFDSDKTGPFLAAAYNLKMMLWTEGQQFSYCEIQDLLQEAGFQDIEIRKSLSNWSLVIGRK